VVDLPRRGVFAATTNEKTYLASRTGNRRIRPIYCHKAEPLPPALREQIWAEAKHRFLAGEDTWQIADTEGLKEAQAERQIDRHDAWHDEVLKYLCKVERTSISDLLNLALTVPVDRQDSRAQQRVTRILQDLGWLRTKGSDGRQWRSPPGWLAGYKHIPALDQVSN
jgi:predicted P-loop ATPase